MVIGVSRSPGRRAFRTLVLSLKVASEVVVGCPSDGTGQPWFQGCGTLSRKMWKTRAPQLLTLPIIQVSTEEKSGFLKSGAQNE